MSQRGRPRRLGADILKTIVWYNAVQAYAHVSNPYQLEKLLSPEKFHKLNGYTVRPCKWDKYRNGIHVPSNNYINEIEHIYPGTKYWIAHPIWEFFKGEDLELREIHNILGRLPKYIEGIIFIGTVNSDNYYIRDINNLGIFTELYKIGNFDAFAACLGLFLESFFTKNISIRFGASFTAVHIYKHIGAATPIMAIYDTFFECIKPFLIDEEFDQRWIEYIYEMDMNRIIAFERKLIKIFLDCKIIVFSFDEYLYFVRMVFHHIPGETISIIQYLYNNQKLDEIKNLSEVRKFHSELNNWRLERIKALS